VGGKFFRLFSSPAEEPGEGPRGPGHQTAVHEKERSGTGPPSAAGSQRAVISIDELRDLGATDADVILGYYSPTCQGAGLLQLCLDLQTHLYVPVPEIRSLQITGSNSIDANAYFIDGCISQVVAGLNPHPSWGGMACGILKKHCHQNRICT